MSKNFGQFILFEGATLYFLWTGASLVLDLVTIIFWVAIVLIYMEILEGFRHLDEIEENYLLEVRKDI